MLSTLLLAGIAYPAMLMATGAPMQSATHWGAPSKPCEAIETADAVFRAGDAGEVTLERSTDALRVVAAAPAEGWEFRIDDGGPDRSVAVVFDKDDARVFFRAAIIDCQVRIRVTGEVIATFTPAPETPDETPAQTPAESPAETPAETPAQTPVETPVETPAEIPAETPAQPPTGTPAQAPAETPAQAPNGPPAEAPALDAQVGSLQAAHAGTVTIELAGQRLKVLSVAPAADWTYEVKKEGPSRMVRVRFRSDDARVELVARIHKGKVVVRTSSVSIAGFGDETPVQTPDTTDNPTTPVVGTPEPPADQAGDTQTYPVGPTGSITLRQGGTTLEVVSVRTKDGWTSETLAGGPAERVSVLFSGPNGFAFELHATLDDGRVKFDARRLGDKPRPVPPAAETRTVEAGPAGTVTLEQTGNVLELVSVQPAEGWTYAVGRRGPGEVVRVLFLSARGGLFLMADVEEGEIDVDMRPIPLDGVRDRDGRDGDTQEARGADDDRNDDLRGDRDRGRDNDR